MVSLVEVSELAYFVYKWIIRASFRLLIFVFLLGSILFMEVSFLIIDKSEIFYFWRISFLVWNHVTHAFKYIFSISLGSTSFLAYVSANLAQVGISSPNNCSMDDRDIADTFTEDGKRQVKYWHIVSCWLVCHTEFILKGYKGVPGWSCAGHLKSLYDTYFFLYSWIFCLVLYNICTVGFRPIFIQRLFKYLHVFLSETQVGFCGQIFLFSMYLIT